MDEEHIRLQEGETNMEAMELKHADSDSVNSIPPPPPPMGMVVPVASEESDDITEAERLKQQQEVEQELEVEQHQQLHLHQEEEKEPLDKEQHQEKGEEGRNDNCCEKILKCLGLIPCPSLLSWIVLLCGIGCLTGGLLIGTWRTRDLLDQQSLLWFMEFAIIGVVVGMFVVATLLMVTGHISSEPTSRRVFNSFSKNRCARGLNIFVLVVSYLLAALWTLMTVVLSVPLVFIANLLIVKRDTFNPALFGFNDYEYKDYELTEFKEKCENLLICYGLAAFGAFLIVNSMIFFVMAISANITHLRDNRFATLNAYGAEEVGNSKHSVVDTNM